VVAGRAWPGSGATVGATPITPGRQERPARSNAGYLPLSAVLVGALALVAGAQDGAPTAALGVVARAGGPWRSMRGGEIDARIELDLRLRHGAEGGLALDAAGRAIGMAVLGPRRRVLVIPAATLERAAAGSRAATSASPSSRSRSRVARGGAPW
jgi:S1-C subfamily serine protease